MPFDLVIRNGLIVDGSGSAARPGDVGISDGRIAKIGQIGERGQQEIDAEGDVVSPGFIDGHTHMDAQLNWDPLGTSSCWHGVTTAVMGNCGFTLAPSRAKERELVVRNLERAEDISREAMAAGIRWDWETFPEYLDAVERLPKGINYAVYVGHSALRTWAMGERAFEQAATADDLKLMTGELRDALKAGAIGLSTSRSRNHETSDNRPVASRVATWDEVRHLVGTMGDFGAGIFEISHERAARSADPAARSEYLAKVQALAVETKIPITFGIKVSGNDSPDAWKAQLAVLDSTAKAGGRMFGQCSSRAINTLTSFRTALPFDRMPEWRELRKLPLDGQKALLSDPATRKRLVDAVHQGEYGHSVGAEARKPNWDMLQVYRTPQPPYQTVAEIASQRKLDPVEAMIEVGLESNFDAFFMQYFSDEDPVGALEILRHPQMVMTFSDAGAHVSQICDGSIHTHLLAYWMRERRMFTLEQAVRMITHVPAMAWGFKDRGLLREGLMADINIFDPARIGPQMPKVVQDLPGGAKRLVQGASGIRATVVNGRVLLKDGRHTGELPGQLLRGAGRDLR